MIWVVRYAVKNSLHRCGKLTTTQVQDQVHDQHHVQAGAHTLKIGNLFFRLLDMTLLKKTSNTSFAK